MIKEQKRILTLFPHGVIIQSKIDSSGGKTIFSNQEFNSQIVKIRNKFREFDDMKLCFSNIEYDDLNLYETTLWKFLQDHQQLLDDWEIVEQKKVTIWWREGNHLGQRLDEDSDDKTTEKIFSVKSMKVEWDDLSCYMHIFIDTTDLIKLEEARNNIRCQRIMFANASHEFRTPLNAMAQQSSWNKLNNL